MGESIAQKVHRRAMEVCMEWLDVLGPGVTPGEGDTSAATMNFWRIVDCVVRLRESGRKRAPPPQASGRGPPPLPQGNGRDSAHPYDPLKGVQPPLSQGVRRDSAHPSEPQTKAHSPYPPEPTQVPSDTGPSQGEGGVGGGGGLGMRGEQKQGMLVDGIPGGTPPETGFSMRSAGVQRSRNTGARKNTGTRKPGSGAKKVGNPAVQACVKAFRQRIPAWSPTGKEAATLKRLSDRYGAELVARWIAGPLWDDAQHDDWVRQGPGYSVETLSARAGKYFAAARQDDEVERILDKST